MEEFIKRDLEIVDMRTGESLGKYIPKVRKKSHKYCLTFLDNLIMNNIVLTKGMYAILTQMDFKNKISIPDKLLVKLSKAYNIPINTLKCDIQKMLKRQIMLKSDTEYFVNPDYCTKANNQVREILNSQFISLKTKEAFAKLKEYQENEEIEKKIVKNAKRLINYSTAKALNNEFERYEIKKY